MFVTPNKYYPVQGTNKFETVSFPITKAFRVNLAGSTVGSNSLFLLPPGTMVLGFYGKMVEALASSSVATFQIGFTGTQMLSDATGSTTASLGAIIAPPKSTDSSNVHIETYILTAQDSFDCIIATDPISTGSGAGKIDIFLTYVPYIAEALTTSEFPVYSF